MKIDRHLLQKSGAILLVSIMLIVLTMGCASAWTITYDGNNATGGEVPVDGTNYEQFDLVTVLDQNTLEKTGFIFSGWNEEADGSGMSHDPDTLIAISYNVNLYAQWEELLTVTYHAPDATAGTVPVDETTYVADDVVTVLSGSSLGRSNYIFDHWNTASDGSGTDYDADDTFTITADVDLYAIWEPTYHVSYFSNGGLIGASPMDLTKYVEGDTVTVMDPGTLGKEGCVFVEWRMESVEGTSYDPGDTFTMPGDSVTLYAIWVTAYNVTYDANEATSGTAPTDGNSPYAEGATVTVLGDNGLARTGYGFLEWNTQADGNGDGYNPDDSFEISSDTTLYAIWEAVYTVTYNGNGNTGGSAPTDENTYYTDDYVSVMNIGDLVKEGFEFIHWSTVSDGSGSNYTAFQQFQIDANTILYAMWGELFHVTYDANEATGGMGPSDPTGYLSTDEITVLGPNTLVKDGYDFTGWNTQSGGTGDYYSPDDAVTITSDTTLYAIWEETLTVTYDANAGTGSEPTDSTHYHSDDEVTVTNEGELTKTGYTFVGWNTASDRTGTDYDPNDTFNINADVTLYAVWECYVVYYPNGAESGSVPVDGSGGYLEGDEVTVLGQNNLVLSDHEFMGWNTESDGSGTFYVYDETFNIDGDTDLYAMWAQNLSVTYHADDADTGTVHVDSTDYHSGDEVTVLDDNNLYRNGHVFAGWNTLSNGEGTHYNESDTFEITADVDLYAQWYQQVYVSYNPNDETSGTAPEDGYPYLAGVDNVTVLGQSDLLKIGFTFSGWNLLEDCTGTNYVEGDNFTITADTDLYANWTCGVTYNSNGADDGSVPVDDVVYHNESTVSVLGQSGLSRIGFSFNGWNTESDGSGTNYVLDDTFSIAGDITLYANWTCQVTYNNNSATSGTVPIDATSYHDGDYVTVFGQSDLARTGFTYRGWNTQADGEGTHYDESDIFTITGDITLYAEWDEEFTVAYDGNGGTGTQTDSTIYYTGDEVTIKDTGTLVRTYFEFANWNTAADGSGTSYTEDDTFTITADTTLYAQWRGYVTYDANDADLGAVPVDIDNPYMENATVTVKGQNTLSKADYIFVGWDTEADGSGTSYVEDDTFTMAGNETLYAQFDANTYESGTMTIIEFESGSLSSVITERHSTLTDVTSLTIKNGTISVADMGWIRDNLDNLETFRVIENGTFVNDTLPEFAFCDESFDAHDHITTVDLPTIDTVGAHAFRSGRISSINMPNVTTIEEKAFANSIILMDVSLPAVTSMENSAFENCGSLTNVSLPELIIVPDNGFNNCNVLVNVTIPNVTTIGNGSFSYCTALTTIVLSNVTTVGQSAFSYCDALTAINLPNATTVGQAAFCHCNNLDTAILPNVQTIEQQCFYSCDWLVTINVSNATYIGDSAFESCTMLPTISLPKVAIIDDNAFEYCTEMDNISAPLATSVGYEVFYDCYDLTTVYMPKVTDIDEYAFYESGLTKVDMPSLVNVSDSAFEDCEDLVTVSLPNVIIIENEAFESCGSLTTVDAPKVREIDYGTFLDDELLTTVNMPLLTTAGGEVFNGCGLTNISLPALTNISADMFSDCYYMTSAYLPNVIGIDAAGFYYCKNLSTMTLGSTIPVVDETIVSPHAVGDFEVFNELPEDRILYVPATAVASYKAYNDTDPANDTWYGWTVTAIPTEGDDSSSGGGSSGGSSHYVVTQSEDSDNVESTATHTLPIHAGSKVNYDFSGSKGPVIGVSFSPKQDKGTVVARVEVLSQKPDDVAESSGKFYKVMNINIGRTGTISSDNANDINIEFRVSKEWIRENNIDVSTIRLSRYHDDQWNDLPTYQEREEGEYVYFYAETPGFSVFEIVGDEITSTPVVEETSTDTPSPNAVEDIPVDGGIKEHSNFAVFVIVLIAGIGYFVWNNKQNKDGKH